MDNPIVAKVPSYDSVIEALIKAEQHDGWLSWCVDHDRYVVINREFIASLSKYLRGLASANIVEICAGTGELTEGMKSWGIEAIATDINSINSALVTQMSADKALKQFKPDTVIGCFVPFDAGIDEVVLANPNVKHYIVLNAKIGGQFGSQALWDNSEFEAELLDQVTRWFVCRHDLWAGNGKEVLSHGQVWHLRRK